jgi:predicted MPP superfamily phosphohydrolase
MRKIVLLGPPIVFVVANLGFLLLFRFVHMDTVIRMAYNTNTIVFPMLLIIGAGVAAIRARDGRERRLPILWVAAALVLLGIRVYATHVEPRMLQVREVTIPTAKLMRPLVVLHISDIQSAGIGKYEARVFDRIRGLNPDLILFTGDFLQPQGGRTHKSEMPKLAALFRTVNPPLGMYAAEGESDAWIRGATPEELGGIAFVHSAPVEIQRDGRHVRLFGLALAQTRNRNHVPRNLIVPWIHESPPDAINIMLGHRPDYVPHVMDLPIDLCLAGHTHGGQVRLPFYGAIVTSSAVPRAWARGFRAVGSTLLNVSAGIGAGHNKGLPSIRVNCPPEMTLIRFVPAGGRESTRPMNGVD